MNVGVMYSSVIGIALGGLSSLAVAQGFRSPAAAQPQAQAAPAPSPEDEAKPRASLRDRVFSGEFFSLRRSIDDEASAGKPASIVWTSPKGGKDSYALDAAIAPKLDFLKGGADKPNAIGGYASKWSIEPFYEKHRSTLIDKPKDTQHAGLAWTYSLIDTNLGDTPDFVARPQHRFGFAVDYKDDRIKTGQGIQFGASYAPVSWNSEYSPNNVIWRESVLPWYWSGSLSVQGETADGLADTEPGEVYRAKPALSAVFLPFQDLDDPLIEVIADYSGWWNFARSGPFAEYRRYQKVFEAGIDFVVLKAPASDDGPSPNKVSIGIRYHVGSNPEEGEESQTYTELALKLRI